MVRKQTILLMFARNFYWGAEIPSGDGYSASKVPPEFGLQCTYRYTGAQPVRCVCRTMLFFKCSRFRRQCTYWLAPRSLCYSGDGCSDVHRYWPGNAHIGMYTLPPCQVSVLAWLFKHIYIGVRISYLCCLDYFSVTLLSQVSQFQRLV